MAVCSSLKGIKAVLIDLSGTLHIENNITHKAVEALDKLRKSGLYVKFLTNTTKESKSYLHKRLEKCGFQVQESEIHTSLTAAKQYAIKKALNPLFLLEDTALEDFHGLSQETSLKNAVIIGLAPSKFSYEHMNEAFRLVLDGAELIAIHKGRYYHRGDGLALGPGPFVAALEYATGKNASIIGKPVKDFFLSALDDLNCEPHEALMIGDDILDDIEGALKAGLLAILVRTGKYRSGDEVRSSIPPTAICDNFYSAVEFLMEQIY